MSRIARMARTARTVCPHDCPSTCALDVTVTMDGRIGAVRGAKDHDYTRGVICAKVSRYAERAHHADRLTVAWLRKPGKAHAKRAAGTGSLADFECVPLHDAIDRAAEGLDRVRRRDGAEAIWPFHFAGTMGLVQRDGLDRLRHVMGTSRQHSTYCTTLPDAGWRAGTGVKRGSDSRCMADSELVVVWGGNPVNTQVNVMHYVAAAKKRGARFVVVDSYRTRTADKADLHLMPRPGTDGALACALMHVLFAEGFADRDYLGRYTRDADRLEAHLATRDPEWGEALTGVPAGTIRTFARWYGATKASFLRLGYGFARSRNGAVNMHAASCLPAITGAWTHPAGGALYGQSAIYPLDRSLIQGLTVAREGVRTFDQSRIGRVLRGETSELQSGPPVGALFVQNTNPAVVAPESRAVLAGLARDDLFTVVHEQMPTETALLADVLLPASMFTEHDDLYTASGHTHLQLGPKLVDPPGDCISNHDLLGALAARLGLAHEGFTMSDVELVDATLRRSGLGTRDAMLAAGGSLDLAPPHERANFLDGFGTPDGRFRFAPDWPGVGPDAGGMPELPDHWAVIDAPSDAYPLRLVAAPARQFLNTSFNETPSARRAEGEPCALLHSHDVARFVLSDGAMVILHNVLGEVALRLRAFDGLSPGTVVVEGLWPNAAFAGGIGINALVSAEPGKPCGGAVYHDTAVAVRPVGPRRLRP